MKLTKRVLNKPGRPVDFTWPWKNQDLVQKMLAFMRKHNAIGLAAPQIGISLNMFVMEVHGKARACFNPVIISTDQQYCQLTEGCLSFPGEQCTINRPGWIEVKYQDHSGAWISERLQGLESRCFQHELDHVNGITMWDRLEEQNAKQS